MASSAFKSTSRRGAGVNGAVTEPHKAPQPSATVSRRRSHSVSAVSRKSHLPIDVSTEFCNSRDNPLFWATTTTSSPPPSDKEEKERKTSAAIASNNHRKSCSLNTRNARSGISSSSLERGRSVTRGCGDKNGIGQSLSRVRGRSVSRGGVYESEKEQDMATSASAQRRNESTKIVNVINKTYPVRNRGNTWERAKNAGVTTVPNQVIEWSEDDSACSLQMSNLEDAISMGSLSEAEEKKIKAVCEDMKSMGGQRGGNVPPNEIYETVRSEVRHAISDIQNDLETAFRRNNINAVTATGVANTPFDLVNPDGVELISDIRREYAVKLEESEERTRKLRADLAIEEQRGQELDRILKEILPDPKTSNTQRTRRGRRASNERKRMSKHLTEEAMAYFDECVSLSTFDSSDFSAPEDPPYSSVGATTPIGASSLVKGSPSSSFCYGQGNDLHHKQQRQLNSCEDFGMTVQSTQPYHQFSFVDKSSEKVGPKDDDIRSYIKHFERGITGNDEDVVELEASTRSPSYYDAGEYSGGVNGPMECVLLDKVLYKSRIDSGGLLLCGGAVSFLPYASSVL